MGKKIVMALAVIGMVIATCIAANVDYEGRRYLDSEPKAELKTRLINR